MYKECVKQKEMTTTKKQGMISLIPKPNKDAQCIDNWRPISLLTIYSKILVLVYANTLNTGLGDISETQSGFVKNCHMTNNVRLVLDMVDYADAVQLQALLPFLDFYKDFDTIEHVFI